TREQARVISRAARSLCHPEQARAHVASRRLLLVRGGRVGLTNETLFPTREQKRCCSAIRDEADM
ncbi:MAG: hypothetical protein ACXVH3_34360, partial [Solirubrobacteraceae bacterium]